MISEKVNGIVKANRNFLKKLYSEKKTTKSDKYMSKQKYISQGLTVYPEAYWYTTY